MANIALPLAHCKMQIARRKIYSHEDISSLILQFDFCTFHFAMNGYV